MGFLGEGGVLSLSAKDCFVDGGLVTGVFLAVSRVDADLLLVLSFWDLLADWLRDLAPAREGSRLRPLCFFFSGESVGSFPLFRRMLGG
jgi:hypothetical protein